MVARGGSVKLYGGDNYLRYRLHHKEGLLNLINKVNGLLQNPIRILQLGKICEIYNIELKDPKPLTYYNGWLAGFFDTDGSIYLNDDSGQIFITASQKNRFILEALVELYGGTIYSMVKQEAFKWTCFKKKEVLSLMIILKFILVDLKKIWELIWLINFMNLEIFMHIKLHLTQI